MQTPGFGTSGWVFTRQGKQEVRTAFRLRLDPDPAAIALDDLLADCQADSVARVFAAFVKAAEQTENLAEILWIDPNAVIANRDGPYAGRALGRNPDYRRSVAAIF